MFGAAREVLTVGVTRGLMLVGVNESSAISHNEKISSNSSSVY